ncbi:unnamed protein product [Diatraea saccharalis]|uniref:Uncharacterized protein n=1 Tax=Diatraea saccharalis TaxID=40085 RepID=A0A9N9R6A9_9NEOP|nr:unnamed protein product [Diatraea saccharalis]
MVIKKCVRCNSNITKKATGLECSRCEKVVHATIDCAKLSTEQLAALRASDGLEWSCEDCLNNVSRRSSFFIPEDTDEAISKVPFDMQKFMRNITSENKKTIKAEIKLQTLRKFLGIRIAK